MTRNARRKLLNANPSLKKGPLANGSPDLLVRRKAGNHQGESWPCVVRGSSTQSKGPLAHGSPDLLVRRKAGNHQGESGSCVVSASSEDDESEDDEPLWNRKPRHPSASSEDDEPLWNRKPRHPDHGIRTSKPRNPPPQYPTGTAKKIASLERKFGSTEHTYFFLCSPSEEKVSHKPIQYLPKTDKPSRQIALSSGLVPHFILEYHSFQTSPSTPIFDKLCDVIQTLHAMARYRPHNKRNTQRLNGEMHLIGFRPGNDDGKSGGTYVRNTLTPAQTAEDDANWAKLQSHNDFLAGRMEALSRTAFLENQALMQEYGIPNWTQEEWTEMKNEDREHLKFAANVSVTYNDFYNEAHQDKNDLNGWTYGIFAYIDKSTGRPIPPPSSELDYQV
ncbi:Ubiquitin carboxyl-terminal hydrolase 7 [Puccinia graminis f. sp. tritici]|uniref:Ubiquitin carboxyl-terminal hydrolase 7 n=1 Tax=Puccinia graminis f. sp. tritici TaxID=56615 RepID=A0A5B0RMZ4_PUCGR|nr:Ubiquitin carboxyl-terminal hydrolase 7 [Puccinia graminis f. sp. tritici]KAA1126455.1 Ubiquitin carboxyl-terminal hydrolase 7 [Puccinia graminis f. sp. tritici]